MAAPMTLRELHDAIAKAIADAQGHGMREKCERHADAVLAIVGPQLLVSAASSSSGERGGVDAVAEVYEYPRDHHEPVSTMLKGIRFTGAPLPVGTKLYAHQPVQAAQADGLTTAVKEAIYALRHDDFAEDDACVELADKLAIALKGSRAHSTAEPVAQGEAVACWRYRNTLGEVVSEWIDGKPPEKLFDLCGNELDGCTVEVAYNAQPRAVPDGWVAVAGDAFKVLDDVAQFHGQLSVGMYRSIRPRLAAMLATASPQGEPHG